MNAIKPFEAADYLDSEEVLAEYLNAALEDPNPDVFLMAISDVAKARGMSKLAKDAGLVGRVFTRLLHTERNRVMKRWSNFCVLSVSNLTHRQ
ncbi:MAG: putative addiction module antidote protein [Pyrinomonadaceae bacterium]